MYSRIPRCQGCTAICCYHKQLEQNQQQLVKFPNLGAHEGIVPGTSRLQFKTTMDDNRVVVQNIGQAVVKNTTVKISGYYSYVMLVDDSDVLHCYMDLWKPAQKREDSQYQGIDTTDDRNATKISVGAGHEDNTAVADRAIADAYSNRFYVLLESHMPYYQSAL